MYTTMIAIMLAMDFLANNVTRTGELHPDAARKALDMMADFPLTTELTCSIAETRRTLARPLQQV